MKSDNLIEILKNNPNIVDLNLDFTQVDSYALEFLNDQGIELTHISLNRCKRLSKEGLLNFFS